MGKDVQLPVAHVSDTAWWVAEMRAMETRRPDAHFRDPLASKLVGDKGPEMIRRFPSIFGSEFLLSVRTQLIDQMIYRLAKKDIDLVLNLAAGLDTRPYRLDLSRNLNWVEADYAPVIEFKNARLFDDVPTCQLERKSVDLADTDQRNQLLSTIGAEPSRALVITEGLLNYLSADNVADLANDLHRAAAVEWWIMDSMDEGLLAWMSENLETQIPTKEKTPIRALPESGPGYFAKFGWELVEFQSFLTEGKKLDRVPPSTWPADALIALEKSGVALLRRGARTEN